MSKTRGGSKAKERGAKADAGEWKRLVSSGALVVAVAGTLILAALLRAGPETAPTPTALVPPDRETLGAVDDDAPAAGTVPPRPAPAPTVESPPAEEPSSPDRLVGDSLIARAIRDRERLASRAADWTLQFASFCEPEHARSILAELASRDGLYLIERDGCYLVCWGLYGSAELARSAPDVPPRLAGLPDRPFPKRVEDALR